METCQSLKETSPSTFSICETPPSPIAICHAYVILVECICHYPERSHSQQTRGHHPLLSLVFHPCPSLANCLNFVSMAYTRDFQKIQRLFNDISIFYYYYYYYCHHDYVQHDLSWVLIYILEQFLPWMHAGSAYFIISLSVWVLWPSQPS